MAYSQQQKEELFKTIFELIENGDSLRKALKSVKLSSSTFYEWLEEKDDEGNLTVWAIEKSKQYARATELRAEALLDEMFEIVDDSERDKIYNDITGAEITNGEAIQRSRLRYDARKWLVSKLNPKKYGDKVDLTTGGEKITINFSD